jgi:hypothetical protein
MGDEFFVENIETFVNAVSETEISDISKVIKKMIDLKNDGKSSITKKSKPYDILDKIKLNNFSKIFEIKIKKYHIEAYDVVDDAIMCLEDFDACIQNDLFDYYWEVYADILYIKGIDIEDQEKIKENADNIYLNVQQKILKDIFGGKESDIPSNKKITYISAITSYVFYKCKFLIPIESID